MFTGIIEEVGKIDRISRGSRSARLRISCKDVTEGTKVGDSIAVNGVCLTATAVDGSGFEADVMDETVARTSLATLKAGSSVNLERAMPANGRFGGHIVAGHVDCIGKITSIKKEEMAVVYEIEVISDADRNTIAGRAAAKTSADFYTAGKAATSSGHMRYIVEKGSIAIDGISLTVASVGEKSFTVSIIPHTISNTTLADKKSGDIVNLETDIIGKYVEKLLMTGSTNDQENKTLSGDFDKAKAFLTENGFGY